MRWDAVVAAWLVPIAADSVVRGVLGTERGFYMAGEREFEVDSLEYQLIVPAVLDREVFWRTLVQLDFWVRTMADLVTLEKALVRLLHSDLAVTIGGIEMWTELVGDGRPLEGAADNTFTRSLDFRLTYLRNRYDTT